MVDNKEYWMVSDEIFKKRIDICNSCTDLTSDRLCSHCMCPMDRKATVDWFACPIGKWPAEVYNV